jgi:hypothetical protein
VRACLVVALLGAATRVAAADGRHVLVLRAEGTADAGTRSKIDVQVLKLAKNVEGNVEAGDISYSDATTAAGCASPTDASCRDEVLATMGADELVVTTVNTAPGGVKVDVKRIAKGNAPREATTTIAAGQPPDAKMNSEIGPMFGVAAPPPPVAEAPKPPPTTTPPPTDKPATPPPPTRTAQVDNGVTAAPNGQVPPPAEGQSGSRRLELTGMGVGASMVLLGAVFWAGAAATQSDINSAPVRSPKDFKNLQDLESRGDTYATLGNVMFIGGAAIAAVSTFFFIRDRRAHRAQTARLAPAVFDHGAGLTLSFGGGP